MSEKKDKEKRRQELLDRAIEAAEAREKAEKSKVELQTYYFVDQKNNRYETTKDVYDMLNEIVQGETTPKIMFTFGFVDHYKTSDKWATITFPVSQVLYVMTCFEKFLPITQQDDKLIINDQVYEMPEEQEK